MDQRLRNINLLLRELLQYNKLSDQCSDYCSGEAKPEKQIDMC